MTIKLNGRVIRTIALSVFAAMLTSASASADVEILFSRFAPPNDIMNTKIIEPWAKNVEKATEGRVKIKFSPTSLAAPQQQWEMVTQGVADAGDVPIGVEILKGAALPALSR